MLKRAPSLSIAARIVLVAALVQAAVLGVTAFALLQNARSAIAAEVDAGRAIARDYVIAAVGSLMRGNEPEAVMSFLPGALYKPRHVRLVVEDFATGVTHLPEARHVDEEAAPEWFRQMLRPPIRQLSLPVSVGARTYGRVSIVSDPSDEIDEVWEDFSALAVIALLSCIAMTGLIALVTTRSLRPLRRMAEAFGQMERGDFSARIGAVSAPELAVLSARFDSLAAALDASRAERDALNRRLMGAQDEERKAVAMELHDEFGPCLFGLKVEARAIQAAATRAGHAEMAERAASILDIVSHIQTANRRLLSRLRPMELGQLPLSQVLETLAQRSADLADDMAWTIQIDPDLGAHDETVELTAYRVVQEAMTNCLRHSGARAACLSAQQGADGAIDVLCEDDGAGPRDAAPGAGLSGMRQRLRAVGGALEFGPRPGGGTRLRAYIPADHVREAKQ